ncbi:MAG: hypothetical protein M1482_06445 [Chloroflexi bacterium]|nr:hypothetical protein [Chloroflexota bacterium]
MNRRTVPSNAHDLVWLSGWVFADLLLGLVVIFLAGMRGSSPVEIAALTPSPTPTSTVPGPTPTPYPTYTPGPSPTPYPTYTPGPSPTPYPTYTPGPSPTAYPTYTPYPTLKPSVVPALAIGLDPSPYIVSLRTDPTLFLSASASDKQAAESQFGAQIHSCLDSAAGGKIGLVLGTGYNPDVTNGHELAQRAMAIVQEEIPSLMGNAVQKDYHALTNDPLLNGMVTLEMYFIADPKVTLPKALLGAHCQPPPRTWCQGKESTRSLIVYNWDVAPSLTFVLDNQNYTVKSASGTTTDGDNRTVGCIMVSPGPHYWKAGNASGSFTVAANRDPDPIRLCSSPAQLCSGGQAPSTPAAGVQ